MAEIKRFSKKLNRIVITYKYNLSFSTDDDIEIYRRFCQLYSEDVISKLCKNAMQKSIDNKDYLCFTMFDDIDTFSCERSSIRDFLKDK